MASTSLRVVPTSRQDVKARYSKKDKYHNLYFVAYRDTVHVFEPTYPNQIVSSEPAGIITLPQSRPGLGGYLMPSLPQGANHIIVRDLGEEEILLIACDGGDVIAYTTRAIEKATRQIKARNDTAKNCILDPLFHENVGASAWGLDVHKSKRLIAVSSNTHGIIVFAFALFLKEAGMSSKSSNFSEQERDEMNAIPKEAGLFGARLSPHWESVIHPRDCRRREKTNYAWGLIGHDINIPAIAFYDEGNPGCEKVYLVTTDIEGAVKIFDVWAQKPLPVPTDHYRGWATACLDPSTARIATSETETYGCVPERSKEEQQELYVATSGNVGALSDNSLWHPAFARLSTVPTPSEPTTVMQTYPIEAPLNPPELDDEDADVLIADILSDEADDVDEIDQENISGGGMPGQIMIRVGLDSRWPKEYSPLPCNILVTSETNIQMTGNRFGSPWNTVCCDKALQQKLPPGYSELKAMERLNMIHQIPELGVVVIGNQTGRVGVLTTTYWPAEKRYGFRLEAIVPFMSQEEQGARPEVPLLGMAVSPVQGHTRRAYSPSESDPNTKLAPQMERRYRLLMMYYDHTILTYEIARPRGKEDILVS